MSYSTIDLTNYRIDRAKESIQEARILADEKHWNTVANRLYYACFYATSAYLVFNRHVSGTHSTVKALFNSELVSKSQISKPLGLVYNKLFDLRQTADYRDFADVSEQEILPLISQVDELVSKIVRLIFP